MTELSESLQSIPIAGLIPVVLLVVVGLLLWGAGRKVLRAGFAAGGFLLGSLGGWILGEQLQLGVPPWAVGAALGVLLACVAALTYRLAVAAALAGVLAVASPLAVVAVNELQGQDVLLPAGESSIATDQPAADMLVDPSSPGREPSPEADGADDADEFERWLYPERFVKEQVREHLPDVLRTEAEQVAADRGLALSPEMNEHLDQMAGHARTLADGLIEAWRRTPESLRPILLFAAAMGGLLGMLVGALSPTLSASIVTSFGGSLIWLTALRVLLERFGIAASSALVPETGRGMLTLWIIVAMTGLAIQWTFRPRPADKPGNAH